MQKILNRVIPPRNFGVVSGSHLSNHQTLKHPEIGAGDASCGFLDFLDSLQPFSRRLILSFFIKSKGSRRLVWIFFQKSKGSRQTN
ncbi:MAG: hypothetical protein A2W90_14795 [Bacteroidetes bacterium GWF2_42_66]|nr:MAG: hypothetical protein A2W92_02670 [Bacteroidetes bacterium GWA2_42_15]OFY03212.1 MAG: hypothetical protein A2W89_11970 [Bacteroidetes bacterium GWE2_42_39]OFY43412.1 MAG: hypothetical protein A2W90_14795 [Bacteroidetes bacterium GWF2_42_66]HBL77530.1 hypothetical protein [Prolixibacteraceae bacterium]HCR89882.1 hypothetical protein [Prolixibacteraceae bacterium]